ncbi:NAD-dependent protein deacylase [Nitrosopumilus sp. b3]|uniref:SIR2 family NAD-dependent protein deacylase n=1 Tax=Nitrosopumilus sp. b3 TaxID=2109909 RepID=UPI0015F75201|nr:NAD-dependent deacylase [Nitrosopumilus sp. b3]KAF6248118.1 NAD-dependent protein deacylase [Nitrosopumilus sp. b3]
MFEIIKDKIQNIKKIVVVTGAGVSQESGIPTFRGKDGLWRNHDAMKLATIDAFYDNPELVWAWYNERRVNIFAAKPNPGHKAIAELEKYVHVSILTQNIDGLHQKAGSSEVLELHGSIIKIKCSVCDYKEEIKSEFSEIPPICKCGNILRPDVVWFGESLPQDVWQKSMILASQCDLMIIVGTSLVVSPANTLPMYAKQSDAILIEINPENTEMSSEMDLVIRNTGSNSLPELVSLFKQN